ncbi:dynamin family protein [Paenibacillus wynnii]|uniref:dynamin family protein n=1 Tax=Paenibacillus wynnii TaxID=268407 RepID=UPI00069225ED|nr:dynamin family protein [Paenibacillus wynnii]
MSAERAKFDKNRQINTNSVLPLLKTLMEQWGDAEAVRIFSELHRKERADELTLAFCGHFSAGKSSMINALCQSHVLPSGPIPTSANIVSIRSGNPRALIYPRSTNDDVAIKAWETTPEKLGEYCRNGGDYSAIEVWEEVPLLGSHGVLMDTPGVDSTDDAHQSATRSALHLADVVFYVMDYNHVQSENNLAFAKNLSDWGKPLYLIVNQIDKHREQEISLKEYQRQLENAFNQWGIRCAGLLFTSLKVENHNLNNWDSLVLLIKDLLERRDELLQYSLSCSIHHAAESALTSYREEQREEREELFAELSGADVRVINSELASIEEERELLENLMTKSRLELRTGLDDLLGNANLNPAEVRDLAGQYIESLNPSFRQGLWFTSAKKEKEQNSRLTAFSDLLSRQVNAQVEWHLTALLRTWAETLELWDKDTEQTLKLKLPVIQPGWLAGAVKPGTSGTGEALLNFCRSLSTEIKAQYRRAALELADELLAKLPPLIEERRAALALRELALGQQSRACAALAALDRAADARAAELAALLPPRRTLTPGSLPEVRATPRATAHSAAPPAAEPPLRTAAQPGPAAASPAAAPTPAGDRHRRLSAAAATLAAAAERLRREPAMASAARSLAARAGDLAGGRFTLALFGAFSAGKSSFANALLGEEVLPVSPHPATAAVNRILAPEGDFRHATAVVTMKTMEDFWGDITHSFNVLQLGEPRYDTWFSALDNLPLRGIHPSVLPHAGFLRAAAAGWEESKDRLGKVRTVDLEEYRLLVAEETRACFVQGIDLYYSSPLTESGIVLVDTPGADSLHARHTGVTFGYMKDADAICFVTYYNHAFSKADRSLLAQLGRIKDSFALDKMFFIINASDLASSEEELEEVRNHVAANLRAGGLTAPRIYSLSSLQALEGKRCGNHEVYESSRFGPFEEALAHFAGEELPGLSLAAARDSILSVRRRAEEWQAMASQEQSVREAGFQQQVKRRTQAEVRLSLLLTEERPRRDLHREGEELLYHVRQRLGFSFGRYFQESFHPSLLREDAGNLKDIFAACGRELWRTVQRELEQELWATTLRLEAKGRQLVRLTVGSAAEELAFSESETLFLLEEDQHWPPPKSVECQLQPLNWSNLWNDFKSPRHFFEGSGRDKIKSAVEPLLKEAVANAAVQLERALLTHYERCILEALQDSADHLRNLLSEQELAMSLDREGGDSAAGLSQLVRDLLDLEQSFDDLVDKVV